MSYSFSLGLISFWCQLEGCRWRQISFWSCENGPSQWEMLRMEILGYDYLNSLWPNDVIGRHRSGSTLAQAMACYLTAPTITWTNIDLSLLRSSDIHLRAISLEISLPSVTKISLKIIFLIFYWNLPGANELSSWYKTSLTGRVHSDTTSIGRNQTLFWHLWWIFN